ncbi:MAG: hypothetical protein POELPBGB_02410 [Bacteroidia bacterium]|nr:hypothetical protein [Bacteroidia bacterium]
MVLPALPRWPTFVPFIFYNKPRNVFFDISRKGAAENKNQEPARKNAWLTGKSTAPGRKKFQLREKIIFAQVLEYKQQEEKIFSGAAADILHEK